METQSGSHAAAGAPRHATAEDEHQRQARRAEAHHMSEAIRNDMNNWAAFELDPVELFREQTMHLSYDEAVKQLDNLEEVSEHAWRLGMMDEPEHQDYRKLMEEKIAILKAAGIRTNQGSKPSAAGSFRGDLPVNQALDLYPLLAEVKGDRTTD